MKISIVIPVYNEEQALGACLDALAAQTRPPYEVIVVDNGSTDKTRQIASRHKFVRLLTEDKQGTVFARNAGLNAAKGAVIARIDADTWLPPEWLATVSALFEQDDQLAAVTGAPHFRDVPFARSFDYMQVLLYQHLQKLLSGTDVLWGANMALRRSAWRTVASECSLRTDIDEDIDLTLLLHRHGLRVRFAPALRVSASFRRGQLGVLETMRYLATWPRDYALHRMYPQALIIACIVLCIEVVTLPLTLWHTLFARRPD